MTDPSHRTAGILAVGDELTLGQSLDTNSRFLADRLMALGIRTIEHATVPDDEPAIADAITRLASRTDLVIVSGGLGPTADDLTRQALAKAAGDEIVEDREALDAIRRWATRLGRSLTDAHRLQARRPASAACLPNSHGTAPGLHARLGERPVDVFCLPGPPRELRPMLETHVVPLLRPPTDLVVRTRFLRTFGLGESDVASRLGDLLARDQSPLVGLTASSGIVTCRIRWEAPGSPDEADARIESVAATIRQALGPTVFGEGDTDLPEAVLGLLRARSQTLAVAESCTGGLLGAMLTTVPGASTAFTGGWITYTNDLKTRQLGVPPSLFVENGLGAVSSETARAMAVGALERAGSDHALAITGIAGPDGGSEAKPVGTVWVAQVSRPPDAATAPPVEVRRFVFPYEREAVRLWSAHSALGMLRLRLIDAEMDLLGQRERIAE